MNLCVGHLPFDLPLILTSYTAPSGLHRACRVWYCSAPVLDAFTLLYSLLLTSALCPNSPLLLHLCAPWPFAVLQPQCSPMLTPNRDKQPSNPPHLPLDAALPLPPQQLDPHLANTDSKTYPVTSALLCFDTSR